MGNHPVIHRTRFPTHPFHDHDRDDVWTMVLWRSLSTSSENEEEQKMILFKLLLALLIILFCLICLKFVSKRTPKTHYIMDDININMTYTEYMRVIDWQFQMGIINAMEYTHYQNEGMKFLQG